MPRASRLAPPAAALLAAALLACGQKPPAPPPAAAPATGEPAAGSATRLATPQPLQFAPRATSTGTLRAGAQAALGTAVGGTLARVPVKRGQLVAQGALLLVLDQAAALAGLHQAEAGLAAARAQLALADDALGRVEALRAQEGTSEAQHVAARAQRDLAQAQAQAAAAQLEQARVALGHHELRAPFAGVVTHVPEGLGVVVGPGVPLVSLASVQALTLDTTVTQAEAAALAAGARVTVAVPATGARTEEARVAVVLPVVDAGTNRVPVELAVPNGDGRFHAGAFARADLPAAPARPAWRVPAAALLALEAGHAVWTCGADGKARALPVVLLDEEGGSAVVAPVSGPWPSGLLVVERPPVGIVEGLSLPGAAR